MPSSSDGRSVDLRVHPKVGVKYSLVNRLDQSLECGGESLAPVESAWCS